MTAEQWEQVKTLFEQALEQPRSSRAGWLMRNCDDAELVAEALSLLEAHDDGTDFLEQPARAGEELTAALRPDTLTGTRVGPYRLVEEIGRGGMGTVYRAVRDDREFDIEVAVKIVGRGMDTDMLLRRFRTERQILAQLEHPYIGRLLDGGTTPGGLPYFVMEYVAGVPLTEYCDRHRLGVTERLRLFRKVCEAVSYAHQNLVVHRDLKPANILVTAEGTPKLLDFGIARILNGGGSRGTTEPTVTMLRMATPAYASPEQIRGGAVGQASDIYSLGVILYELLTGHRPYRLPSRDSGEVARVISEREPTRASVVIGLTERVERSNGQMSEVTPGAVCHDRHTTIEQLRRRLRGDLDNILAMALRKEPHRRYETADQFGLDLHRHLAGLPIVARKDTLGYRASKFVERHRIGVFLGVAALLMVLATAVYAFHKAAVLSARVQEDHRLASSFLVEIHDTIAKLPGSMAAREAVLAKSLQYLNGLARDAGGEAEFRRSLALAYERFAELQIGVGGPGLGRSADAMDTIGKALAIREELARQEPSVQVQYELANSYLLGSYIAGRAGHAGTRAGWDREALALADAAVKADPRNAAYRSALARAHTSIAYGLLYGDQWESARDHLRRALAIHTEIAAENPLDFKAKRELAQIHYRLGSTYAQLGQPAHAREHLMQALELQEKMAAVEPENTPLRSDIAATHHFLGVSYGSLRQTPEALAHFAKAIGIRKAALAQDPRDLRSRWMMAGTFAERASVLLRAGELRAALASATTAAEHQQTALEQDPKSVPGRISMAGFEGRVAAVQAELGARTGRKAHWSEALEWAHRSADRYEVLGKEGHLRSQALREDRERAQEVLRLAQIRLARR